MSWYRTYRPQSVAGLHLEKVRSTFQRYLQDGYLPQVMLFAGPKGTGKTSTARIIAAILNEPENQTAVKELFSRERKKAKGTTLKEPQAQSDLQQQIFTGTSFLVQELDAASHRGIDDVRALKERVHLAPQMGQVSVFILDEVHMLTTEAFNALLKLLEEPPSHAVFILATTELHKVPATVVSRCTVIEFTKATPTEITTSLEAIAKAEKMKIDAEALTQIAEVADGSFRDAVKLLESISHMPGNVTASDVAKQLRPVLATQIAEVVTAVTSKQPRPVAAFFEICRQQQYQPQFVYQAVMAWLHEQLLIALEVKTGASQISAPVARFLLHELQSIPPVNHGPIPLLSLELKLLEIIFRAQEKAKTPSAASAPPSASPKIKVASVATSDQVTVNIQAVAPTELPASEPVTVETEIVTDRSQALTNANLEALSDGDSEKLLSQWDQFITLVNAKNASLAAVLRSAQPRSLDKSQAEVAVFYKFHKDQLQTPKFQAVINECIPQIAGGFVKLEFVVTEPTSSLAEAALM